jgi:hypothetical protein
MDVNSNPVKIKNLSNILVNTDFITLLEQNRLVDYESIYGYEDGHVIKEIPQRTVTRFKLKTEKNEVCLFMKRHKPVHLNPLFWIFHRFADDNISPGVTEFKNICEFRNKGISTVVPVAAGQKFISTRRVESFLITKDFSPFATLEFIQQKDQKRLLGPDRSVFKKKLIEKIANLASEMHKIGFNHRDFNATHLLISPEKENFEFSLAIFDLQRIDRKRWMRIKWMIKTFAELFYSMPEEIFSIDDKIALYKSYHNIDRIGLYDKFILFLIKRKIIKIRRHTVKINERKIIKDSKL